MTLHLAIPRRLYAAHRRLLLDSEAAISRDVAGDLVAVARQLDDTAVQLGVGRREQRVLAAIGVLHHLHARVVLEADVVQLKELAVGHDDHRLLAAVEHVGVHVAHRHTLELGIGQHLLAGRLAQPLLRRHASAFLRQLVGTDVLVVAGQRAGLHQRFACRHDLRPATTTEVATGGVGRPHGDLVLFQPAAGHHDAAGSGRAFVDLAGRDADHRAVGQLDEVMLLTVEVLDTLHDPCDGEPAGLVGVDALVDMGHLLWSGRAGAGDRAVVGEPPSGRTCAADQLAPLGRVPERV